MSTSEILKAPIWRTVLELSSMSNNHEYVMHGDHEVSFEEAWGLRIPGCWQNPRLVMSRQITDLERQAGLNVTYQDDAEDEGCPPVTRALDELHKLYRRLEMRINGLGHSAAKAIAHTITYDYYDCMSAGMSFMCCAALRHIILQHNVPLDTSVDGSRTLQDFLNEIEDVPQLTNLLAEHDIPPLPALLGAC